jgi:purine-binding chemotaxis protein CheW
MLSKFHKHEESKINEKKQFVVFTIGKEEFGVDIKQTREIIDVTESTLIPNAPDFVNGVINLRGEIVPVVKLKKRLNIKSEKTRDDIEKIIIIDINNNLIGIQVNEVKEIIRLDINQIADAPNITKGINKDYINGVGKLDDRLLILLNLNKVLSTEEIEQLDEIKV